MWSMTDDFGELVEVGLEDVTEAEHLPAVVEARVIERSPTALVPAVHAAAAAATGFVAGAATVALLKRLGGRRVVREQRLAPLGPGRTRTFLVHVRVLD